jgi:hypothetical protein
LDPSILLKVQIWPQPVLFAPQEVIVMLKVLQLSKDFAMLDISVDLDRLAKLSSISLLLSGKTFA